MVHYLLLFQNRRIRPEVGEEVVFSGKTPPAKDYVLSPYETKEFFNIFYEMILPRMHFPKDDKPVSFLCEVPWRGLHHS